MFQLKSAHTSPTADFFITPAGNAPAIAGVEPKPGAIAEKVIDIRLCVLQFVKRIVGARRATALTVDIYSVLNPKPGLSAVVPSILAN